MQTHRRITNLVLLSSRSSDLSRGHGNFTKCTREGAISRPSSFISSKHLERGPVLWFSLEDQTPNATGFVRAPQRPDDRKFGSSRVLQINLPLPELSIRSRRPDHRPRQSVAFWFSRTPRRGSLQRTSHATPIFGRVRPLTPKAAQPSPARGWPRDHAASQSLARTPLARQQPALALPPPTP